MVEGEGDSVSLQVANHDVKPTLPGRIARPPIGDSDDHQSRSPFSSFSHLSLILNSWSGFISTTRPADQVTHKTYVFWDVSNSGAESRGSKEPSLQILRQQTRNCGPCRGNRQTEMVQSAHEQIEYSFFHEIHTNIPSFTRFTLSRTSLTFEKVHAVLWYL